MNDAITDIASSIDSVRTGQEKLTKRDWFLLPLIGFCVVCLLAVSTEMIARRVLTTSGHDKSGESCMVMNDPSTGARGIPNCTVIEKIFEAPSPVEYRFNSSGYRDDSDFGPKEPGIFRITMIGTSIAGGFRVPEQQTFAALLPKELSTRTGRKVELYNEAMPWRSPRMIARNFKRDVLGTNPDMVLWILTAGDVTSQNWRVDANPAAALNDREKFSYYIKSSLRTHSLTTVLTETFAHSRTSKLLQVLLYKSPSLYVNAFLLKDPEKMAYMKSKPPAQLLLSLHQFDECAGEIAQEADKMGVPIVVVLVPDRTQAAMISMTGGWPAGIDPYKFGEELRPIITSHRWTYIDLLPDYRTIPNPQLDYFPLDGHPNADGQATISKFLAKHLTDGAISSLVATNRGQAALAQGSH